MQRWTHSLATLTLATYMFCQDLVLHNGECTIPIYDQQFMRDMTCAMDLWQTLIDIWAGRLVPDPTAVPHPDG